MMKRAVLDRESAEILRKAGVIAREMGHSYVGSEHLLLALCCDPGCRKTLSAQGLDYCGLYAAVECMRGCGSLENPLPQGLSQGAKRVFSLAAEEGAPVRPASLLKAIGRENSTTAALLLAGFGICGDMLQTESVRKTTQQEDGNDNMRLLERFGVNMIAEASSSEGKIFPAAA